MSDNEDDVAPPVFMLKIWCTDDDVNHDGYCSDPGTPVHDVRRRQLLEDIPANLPDDVIKANGAVDITCTSITALEHVIPHGNGYCGLRSTRTITRAMIVKNPTFDCNNWYSGPSNQLTSDREDDDDYDSEHDYVTDEEICRCRCNCRRRCRCGPCTCESLYKNRKTGTKYLECKRDRERATSDEDEEGVEEEI